MKFKNLGNMTEARWTACSRSSSTYKKNGHFRAFWSTFNESVNLMASKEVVIESMWSPAVALLVAQGVNCRYAFPKEGMRGWCSAQGDPEARHRREARRGYDYLNWMYEGYLGALIMRQGYYIANGTSLPKWLQVQPCEVDRKACVHAGGVRLLVQRQACRARPPGHHRTRRRHQEGPDPRRRLVHQALLQVHRLELVLHRERVPGEEVQRVPQRLGRWRRKPSDRHRRGRRAPPPPPLDETGFDLEVGSRRCSPAARSPWTTSTCTSTTASTSSCSARRAAARRRRSG